LQIYPPQELESALCEKIVDFRIKLRSQNPVEGKMHFQIQSRSSVVYSGSYHFETGKVDLNIGENKGLVMIMQGKYLKKRELISVSQSKFYQK
jgi:hypothetical protein